MFKFTNFIQEDPPLILVRKSDETSRSENLSKNGKDVTGPLSDAHNSSYD